MFGGKLKRMMELYASTGDSDIVPEETNLVSGAIDFHQKCVGEVMTAIDDVFMLEIDSKLDFDTLCAIYSAGHSRIPIFEKHRNFVVGLLFVKELILIDPEDAIPIRSILADFFGRNVPKIFPDMKLDKVLDMFQTGRSHLALVHDVDNSGPGDPFYVNKGIVTLEDLMEELIQEEILDETDADPRLGGKGGTKKQDRPLLKYFQQRRKRNVVLSNEEIQAITSFLMGKFPETFGFLTQATLVEVVRKSKVLKFEVSEDGVPVQLIYRGRENEAFLLVLDGQVKVVAGMEEFESEKGAWSSFSLQALKGPYIPDFSLFASRACRILFISRPNFQATIGSSKRRLSRPAENVMSPPNLETMLSTGSNGTDHHNAAGSPTISPKGNNGGNWD